MNNVCSIREAVSRLREDGLPVSEYTLRAWVRGGVLPCRRIGRKALLYYPALRGFIEQADSVAANDPVEAGGIRRLEANL